MRLPLRLPLALMVLAALVMACGAPPPTPTRDAAPSPTPTPVEPDASSPALPAQLGPAEAALRRSLFFEKDGQLELAAGAAKEALDAGAGRPASLQLAKVAILRQRWDEAEEILRALLETNPDDADAHYNLGLVAQRRGRYNDARSGYPAALRAREDYPEARYNLAVLTWNRDVREEARHHVARFTERWPDDPRAQELAALVGSGITAKEATP